MKVGFINKISKMFIAHVKDPDRFAVHEKDNCLPGWMGLLIIAFALECLESFCEGVPSKYMLLSRVEQRELQRINGTLEKQYQDSDCTNVNMFHNDQQLLSYICSRVLSGRNVLLGEFRYLRIMLAFLAIFLRGGSYCLQMYLGRRGFLDYLIKMISSVEN